jgi:hypothetical protein
MSGTKGKCLTLEEKVIFFNYLKVVKVPEWWQWNVAVELGVGCTQVQNVLKRKPK